MAFALFLLYVVFTFLRPVELFAPGLAEARPMLVLWLLAFAAALLSTLMQRRIALRPVHAGLLIAFIAALALSRVANGWAGGAMDAVSEFSASALLLVLAAMNLTRLRRLQWTLATVTLCMLVLSLFAVNAYETGHRADDFVLRQGTGDEADLVAAGYTGVPAEDDTGQSLWRVHGLGILNDPNDFGQALVMSLPLLALAWRPRRALRNALIVGLPMALMLYAIYLTHSRGALLGIAVLGLMALRGWLGSLRTAVIGALGLVLAMGLGLAGGREFSTQEQSAGQRIEAWYEGLQMFRENPLFGVGYGAFTDYHPLTAHNSFVLCFAELGLVGLLPWVALLVLAWRELGQVAGLAPPGSTEARMAEALRMALLGFLACAWFLSRTYQPLLYLLLGLCIAAAWAARERALASPETHNWPAPRWQFAAVFTALGSIVVVYAFVVLERITG
ncbi:O-antigen ligase family protein [Aquimonas voraii]|uniref:O-antigen ligase like membrane protein n=1 Tax=Aquimonas voraii TaxID=265719 RepID=A0A1G6WMF6_9GAMM|nr:O-antigen ligase family protein [Aquimonas voraii]SDD66225.1 O-antigen ligase like membrane protein [Aquimonas voraii]